MRALRTSSAVFFAPNFVLLLWQVPMLLRNKNR
jgi:hypothetical protein